MLERYRHLREISRRHNEAIQKLISQESILQHARRLGLARGNTFLLEDLDELTYALDLAIHTAPPGRSRAIDRYAESAGAPLDGDERLMLDAMRASRFSILRIERRHPIVGLVTTDLALGAQGWLIDIGLESSVSDGATLATRLYMVDGFSMTAGVNVPLDTTTMLALFAEPPRHLKRQPFNVVVNDRRFAETIYRTALASGLMDRVAYRDASSPAGGS
ncbi:MAG: hypothetical protein K2X72_15065 [Reyranella sp.]|nr:hypothetical protein [Reyranella sp.]